MDEQVLLSVLVATVVVAVSMGLRSSLCRRREPPPTLAASSVDGSSSDDEDDREPSALFVAASTFMAKPPVKLNLQPTQQLVFYSLYKQVSRLLARCMVIFAASLGCFPFFPLRTLAAPLWHLTRIPIQPHVHPCPPIVLTEATVGDNDSSRPSMLEMTGRAKW